MREHLSAASAKLVARTYRARVHVRQVGGVPRAVVPDRGLPAVDGGE